MGTSLVRVLKNSENPAWGILERNEVHLLSGPADSLRKFLTDGGISARSHVGIASLSSVAFLSPVTSEAQILCQGKNYLAHLLETGVKPENKEFNLIFTKASSSIAPPVGDVHRPPRVELLDYELEMGIVLKTAIHCPTKITRENLHKFIAGIVMANDISARDVQVPERQWFKGKSFRGFCPVGPVLYLVDEVDIPALYNLDLYLKVNGGVRQKANTAQLMYKPEETLTELSEIIDLQPGDLLLTGTPGGVAMRIEKNWKTKWRDFFKGEKEKMDEFLEEQKRSPRYLKNNDRIESSIRSPDGKIDLGMQNLLVRD